MKRASAILPESLPPIGINREQAAALIGVSATMFDRLVASGMMPDGRLIFSRIVWDVAEVAEAFRAIPHRSETVDAPSAAGNPWDDAA
ncbi:hypothetical protein [Tianweitania sediminis]|uniref:Uncharacterized protein n=1 Tax=Tianweitania sediminis TaxID=1502156 RepID=A0A8J7UKK9_9HYPH|nr:hypothetical protein [Tianweitania sediminis]MBP0438457.1 hypothetical protein [Tianweitania sediminis]